MKHTLALRSPHFCKCVYTRKSSNNKTETILLLQRNVSNRRLRSTDFSVRIFLNAGKIVCYVFISRTKHTHNFNVHTHIRIHKQSAVSICCCFMPFSSLFLFFIVTLLLCVFVFIPCCCRFFFRLSLSASMYTKLHVIY